MLFVSLCLPQSSTSIVTLLILTYHPSIEENLPCYMTNEQNSLVVALVPHSHIYRQFYSDVLHLWKENQLPSFPLFETVEGKSAMKKQNKGN